MGVQNGLVTHLAFSEGDPRASWPLKEPETHVAFALAHGGRSSPPVTHTQTSEIGGNAHIVLTFSPSSPPPIDCPPWSPTSSLLVVHYLARNTF